MRPDSFVETASPMFLDESLPVGVLDNADTEAWWDECLQIHGKQAWAKWEQFRREQEARSREVEHG